MDNQITVSIPYRYGITTEKSRLLSLIILKNTRISTIFSKKVGHPLYLKIVITIDFIGFSKNVKYWNEHDRLFELFLIKIRCFFNEKHPQNQ